MLLGCKIMSDAHNIFERYPQLPAVSIWKDTSCDADLPVAGHRMHLLLRAVADGCRNDFTWLCGNSWAVARHHDSRSGRQIAPADTVGPIVIVGRVLGLWLRWLRLGPTNGC
jgi:hypothetical protein